MQKVIGAPRSNRPISKLPPALAKRVDACVGSSALGRGIAKCRRRNRGHRRRPLRDRLSTSFTPRAYGQLAIQCMTAGMRAHRDRLTFTRLIVSRADVIAMGKHLSERPRFPPMPGEPAGTAALRRRAWTMRLAAGARLTPPPVATTTRPSSAERLSRGGV